MSSFAKRSMFLVCVGAISVPLVAAALAYGCTAVATLTASQGAATAGTTLSVTGKYFGGHDESSDNTNGLAEIRLGSLTGPVLATASPTTTGDNGFTVNVTIPADTPAGDTFIAATQKRANGTPVYGTPARQAFKVLASSAPSGGGPTEPTTNKVMATEGTGMVAETLTLSEARRAAKMKIKRSNRSARRLRASCSRRSRTSATCMVRFVSNGKSRSKRVVIKSEASASAW